MIDSQVFFDFIVRTDKAQKSIDKFASFSEKRVRRISNTLAGSTQKVDLLNKKLNTVGSKSGKKLAINSQLKVANGHMDRLMKKASLFNKRMSVGSGAGMISGGSSRGAGMGSMGMLMGTYLGPLAGAMAFGSIIEQGSKFKSTMVDVRGILESTGNITDKVFSGFEGTLTNIGVRTKFTMGEVAGAAKYMAMAGLDLNTIKASMPAVTNLSAVAGDELSLQQAADRVTNIQTGFGIKGTKSNMRNISDILTGTFTRTNVSLGELAESFSYVGNTSAQSGISFQETAAAIGLLGNAGIKGSRAGTNLRQMLLRLQAPTEKGRSIMKKYGLQFTETYLDPVSGKNRDRLKSLVDIVGQINNATANSGLGASEKKDLFNVFGGTAFGAIATQLDNGKLRLQRVQEEVMANSGNLTERLARRAMNTFSGQIKKLKSEMEAVSVGLFSSISPAILQVVGGTRELLSELRSDGKKGGFAVFLTQSFNTLSNIIYGATSAFSWLNSKMNELDSSGIFAKIAGSVVGLYSGFKVLSFLGSPLVKTFSWIGAALTGLAAKSTFLTSVFAGLRTGALLMWAGITSPVGLVLAGLTGVGLGVATLWDKFDWFRGGVMGIWDSISLGFQVAFGGITNVANGVIDRLTIGLGGISNLFGNIADGNWTAVKQNATDVGSAVLGFNPYTLAADFAKGAKDTYDNSSGIMETLANGYQNGVDSKARTGLGAWVNKRTDEAMSIFGKPTQSTTKDITVGKTGEVNSSIAADLNANSGTGATGNSIGLGNGIKGVRAVGTGSARGNLNVEIHNLIGENFSPVFNSVSEGMEDIKNKLATALIEVVQDFELGYSG